MKPDIEIDGIQLGTYLRQYKIQTDLELINYKQDFSVDRFVESVNTNIFYKDDNIVESDVNFKLNIIQQEKDLILEALNKLRLKLK